MGSTALPNTRLHLGLHPQAVPACLRHAGAKFEGTAEFAVQQGWVLYLMGQQNSLLVLYECISQQTLFQLAWWSA